MSDHIQEVSKALDSVERCLRKVKALHVNSAEAKGSVRDFVRSYFERSRPGLLAAVSVEEALAQLDRLMQDLLRYSQRRTSIDDYRRCLTASKRALSEVELCALNSLNNPTPLAPFEPRQTRILESLRKINSGAAAAYEQGL